MVLWRDPGVFWERFEDGLRGLMLDAIGNPSRAVSDGNGVGRGRIFCDGRHAG